MFYLTVAWLFSYMPRDPQNDARPLIPLEDLRKSVLVLVWSAAMFGIFYFSYQPAKESVLLSKMRNATVNERARTAEKIFAISPMGKIYDEASIISEYANRYLTNLMNISDKHKGIVAEELKVYLTIISKRNENDSINYFRMYLAGSEAAHGVYAYSMGKDSGYLATAKEYAEKAASISPRNQLGYWNLAQVYISSDDFKKAMEFADMAVALEPRARESHEILLSIISLTGNQKLFAEKLKQAQANIPGFIYP